MQYLRLFSALLLLLVLAACSELPGLSAPTVTPRPTAGPEINQQAGGGGEFIMSLGTEVPTLDPARVGDVTSALVTRQIFSGLVRLSNELEAEPDLAERWDISDNGRTYTFYLRQDATFADGTPITADDVRWSLERAIRPEHPTVSTYLGDIDGALEKLSGQANSVRGLEVVDEHTIAITLRTPNAVFLLKLTNPPGFIVDRRAVEQGGRSWTDTPNGSGPFVLHEIGQEALILRPNLRYYGRPAKPDQLTLLLGAAGANELVLYEQGRVDYADVPASAIARVRDPGNPLSRELVTVPGLTLSYLGMNTAMPPFDDPKVREAFSLLIDRQKLAEGNEAIIPARGLVPPTMPGANPDLPPPPKPNATKIKQLLEESRYGSAEGLPEIVGYTGGGSVGLLDELLQETVGLTMEVRSTETFGTYLQGLNAHQYALFDLTWIADYPDPENFLEALFGARSGNNFGGYSNSEVEQLFAQARAEQDEQRRYELYQQAEQVILRDHAAIPLYHNVEHVLVKPYVKGLEITPQGLIDLSTVELAP